MQACSLSSVYNTPQNSRCVLCVSMPIASRTCPVVQLQFTEAFPHGTTISFDLNPSFYLLRALPMQMNLHPVNIFLNIYLSLSVPEPVL